MSISIRSFIHQIKTLVGSKFQRSQSARSIKNQSLMPTRIKFENTDLCHKFFSSTWENTIACVGGSWHLNFDWSYKGGDSIMVLVIWKQTIFIFFSCRIIIHQLFPNTELKTFCKAIFKALSKVLKMILPWLLHFWGRHYRSRYFRHLYMFS